VATSFPQVIGGAASFNESLWRGLGEAIGTEARGKFSA
jgi:beta-glucosidase-like glycosyl hydrolase